ncbi:Cell division coordinator CpoB [Paraburkholderia caffeinitolerans]|uniref:Cell division coordinator CpoB n=1 Tax=Paraburkholderia caffeinitolerans TaxID=1723730 RepID=A0A6J5FU09_9BURK|nr:MULTISPECIES: tetratricopeptide repeat protein [Paraburkholderia]CAB3786998.1 Cell division coordinator CpoB [Paraburkholderia caffeinitolerans]
MEQVFVRAYAAHRDGRLDDAERGYRATLAADPVHVDALHMLGVLRHQQGQHAEAADLVRRAVSLRPDDAALQLNLGNALKALGELEGAIERFRNALTLAPAFALAHYNLGNAYAAVGRHEDAMYAFGHAVRLQPGDASSHNNLGNALHALGRHAEAAEAFRRALKIRPGHAGAHNNLGMALNALGDCAGAVEQFQKALRFQPRFVAAHFNLANTLDATGYHAQAVAGFETALALQPQFPPALFGLGNALAALGRHEEALSPYERAIGLDPKFALAWLALGSAQHALGRHAAALRAFDEALRVRPDLAAAHLNRALILLTLGDFPRGLAAYEWRLDPAARESASGVMGVADGVNATGITMAAAAPAHRDAAAATLAAVPRWRGEPLAGRTLLIHAEQGFGDTLQFVRFVPNIVALAHSGARIVLEVQAPLVPLIAPAAHVAHITLIEQGAPRPAVDLHCPLLSLPLALGTTYETVPAPMPYLAAPPAYRRKWRGSLGGQAKRKIGLAWSGRIMKLENRSMPLAALEPLFALEGIDWIVLQPNLSEAEHAALDAHPRARTIHRLDGRLDDFADTAAVIERLDAVVSIDTSIAHLAGALGAKLWLMLPFAADWRWFADTDASPWYPRARLVRQPRPGSWDEVVARVAAALREA